MNFKILNIASLIILLFSSGILCSFTSVESNSTNSSQYSSLLKDKTGRFDASIMRKISDSAYNNLRFSSFDSKSLHYFCEHLLYLAIEKKTIEMDSKDSLNNFIKSVNNLKNDLFKKIQDNQNLLKNIAERSYSASSGSSTIQSIKNEIMQLNINISMLDAFLKKNCLSF